MRLANALGGLVNAFCYFFRFEAKVIFFGEIRRGMPQQIVVAIDAGVLGMKAIAAHVLQSSEQCNVFVRTIEALDFFNRQGAASFVGLVVVFCHDGPAKAGVGLLFGLGVRGAINVDDAVCHDYSLACTNAGARYQAAWRSFQ